MATMTGVGWPPSAVRVFGRTASTPQDGRRRPSYALMTRESFVAERRGNVWRRRHKSLGRPMVWRWFDRRSATRWLGGMAPPRRMGGNPRRPSVRHGGLCDQGQEPIVARPCGPPAEFRSVFQQTIVLECCFLCLTDTRRGFACLRVRALPRSVPRCGSTGRWFGFVDGNRQCPNAGGLDRES